MKNQVIEVLNKDHGRRVIEYFNSLGANTLCYKGECSLANGNACRYYGIINGEFDNFHLPYVEEMNAEIIQLPPYPDHPRVMQVSDDGREWKTRVVFMEKKGFFLAWHKAKTIEASLDSLSVSCWKYAREVPVRTELTMQQIADKFNVDVNGLIVLS